MTSPRPTAASGELRVALGLALGPAVALGLARFAYALLLPSMRADLGWSFAVAGAMNTANAGGYLGGALLAATIARRFGARRSFIVGLAVSVAALGASASTSNLAALLGLRILVGAAGALSFVAGAGLVAQLNTGTGPSRAPLLLGVYFAGGGAGIVVSGLTIPALLTHTNGDGWRAGWLLLAGLAAVALAGSIPAVRAAHEAPATPADADRWPARSMAALIAAYTFFGAGYIAYMTFIVAFLEGHGASPGAISGFWVTLGVAAVAAGFGWGPILPRFRGGKGPAMPMAVVTAGALLPLLSQSTPVAFASAVFFGASFLSVVTAVTALARSSLLRRHWTAAIGALTTAFAVGQCGGPLLAGLLSDGPDGIRAGLALSVGVLAAATLMVLAQPERQPAPPPDPIGTADALGES